MFFGVKTSVGRDMSRSVCCAIWCVSTLFHATTDEKIGTISRNTWHLSPNLIRFEPCSDDNLGWVGPLSPCRQTCTWHTDTRPKTTQSNRECAPGRLLPCTPPATSPAAWRPAIAKLQNFRKSPNHPRSSGSQVCRKQAPPSKAWSEKDDIATETDKNRQSSK